MPCFDTMSAFRREVAGIVATDCPRLFVGRAPSMSSGGRVIAHHPTWNIWGVSEDGTIANTMGQFPTRIAAMERIQVSRLCDTWDSGRHADAARDSGEGN